MLSFARQSTGTKICRPWSRPIQSNWRHGGKRPRGNLYSFDGSPHLLPEFCQLERTDHSWPCRLADWSFFEVTLEANTEIAPVLASTWGNPSTISASSGSSTVAATFLHCLAAI